MKQKDQVPPPPSQEVPMPPLPEAKEIEKEVIYEQEIKLLDSGTQVNLPAAPEYETYVLGSFLIDNSLETMEHINLLEPDVFHRKRHKIIMQSIIRLYERGSPIDLALVSEELKRMGKHKEVGGDYYLISLCQAISSATHIEFHIRVLLQKYALRELIFMSRNTMFKSLHNDPDTFKLIEDIHERIAKIENVILKKTSEGSEDTKQELSEKVKLQRLGIQPGIPTGISAFDDWRGGLWKRWLVTIAGRPGMGKTTAVIAMILHMVFEKNIPLVFFSLEMTATDLKYKIAAGLTGIDLEKINSGKLTDEELEHVNQALDRIEESPLEIIDNVTSLDRIVSITRKRASEGVEIFFLDYVQLVENGISIENETARLTKSTRTFKTLKNDCNITFVQLSQLSRVVDTRKDHQPQLSDLKNSGSIEEDSNMVIFIYRPEYYNKQKSKIPLPPGAVNPEYIAEWIVAKGRDTGLANFDIYLDFTKSTMETYSGIQF